MVDSDDKLIAKACIIDGINFKVEKIVNLSFPKSPPFSFILKCDHPLNL